MGTKTRALKPEEFSRYMDTVRKAPDAELHVAALCCLVIGTGARIGEIIQMTAADLFDSNGRPLPSITRTLEKKRAVKPSRLTVEFAWHILGEPIKRWRDRALRYYAISYREPLFSRRWNGQTLSYKHCWLINRRFLVRAGINPYGVAFHGIRKSFLTHMYFQRLEENRGNPIGALRYVQGLAGHESFETTLDYLGDSVERSHLDTMEAAFAKLAGLNLRKRIRNKVKTQNIQ